MSNFEILQRLVLRGDLTIEKIVGKSKTSLTLYSSHQAIKSLAEIYNWTALEENIYQITASKLEEIDSDLLSSIIDSFSPEEASAESAPTLNSLNNIKHPLTSAPSSNPVTKLDLRSLQAAMTATQGPDQLAAMLEESSPYTAATAPDSDDENPGLVAQIAATKINLPQHTKKALEEAEAAATQEAVELNLALELSMQKTQRPAAQTSAATAETHDGGSAAAAPDSDSDDGLGHSSVEETAGAAAIATAASDQAPHQLPPILMRERDNFAILQRHNIPFATNPQQGEVTIHPKDSMNWVWIFQICSIEYDDCMRNANGRMSFTLPIQQLRDVDHDLLKVAIEAELQDAAKLQRTHNI